jgi:hypothetical protein
MVDHLTIGCCIGLVILPPEEANISPSDVAMVNVPGEYFSASAKKLWVISVLPLRISISFGTDTAFFCTGRDSNAGSILFISDISD